MDSADAAEERARDEREQRAGAVDIFTQRIEPRADGLARALVDRGKDKVLPRHPEEQDAGQQRAERADVDGHHVHPVGDDGLNAQRHRRADHGDDRDRRHALEAQLILQRLDRDLVEVHKRGEPREEHAEEEHQPDHAPAGHPVEHVHKENEHQSRAAVGKVRAARCHRGNDDERRQQRRQRIEQRHVARGGGDRLIVREVGAVDHRAVSGHGEREERLPEGVDPQLRVGKARGVEGKDVAVAVARAGQRCNVDAQSRKEEEQHGHHDLVRPLDAAAHAEGHDGEVDRQRDHQPEIIAPAAGRAVEAVDDDIHILSHGKESAVERQRKILEDPAHHAAVADGKRQRAEHRDIADRLARAASAAQGSRLSERADGAGAGGAAKRHLADDAGRADQKDKEEIRQQEGHAAPRGHEIGKAPDVAHAHRAADAGEDKAPAAAECVALRLLAHGVVLQITQKSLRRCTQRDSSVYPSRAVFVKAFPLHPDGNVGLDRNPKRKAPLCGAFLFVRWLHSGYFRFHIQIKTQRSGFGFGKSHSRMGAW